MIFAFPPCTHIAVSGARYFEKKREDGRQRLAIEFFCRFLEADCEKICVENPINIINGEYVMKWFPDLVEKHNLPVPPSQTVQPYWFGDPYKKTTNLWLKGLPLLEPTNMVEPKLVHYTSGDGKQLTFSADYGVGFNTPHSSRRSKTYPGFAKALATQLAGPA